uniref:Chitin-binding type-2 domain-containing protein n=1 Tax=Angiostrongylus cantonensis TaxID=6313 RepID=A0A0K0DLB9_ANGCA
MQRFLGVVICCTAAICHAEIKSVDVPPQHWRAILGDICQLPSFPRATGDPHRYVECVRHDAIIGNREDLGIWLLRECLPGYEFVASARRCMTSRSVKKRQELCNSDNSSIYQFCPSETNTEFLIEEIRDEPRQCECPNGENNCVCPSPEIFELARFLLQPFQFSHYPLCPCPAIEPACTCVTTNNQDEKLQQNCQTTSTQQQYCPQQQQQSAIVRPQACPLVQQGVQGAQYQGICSWMVDPLAADPQSRSHYLQCQPAPKNLFCGRWQRMPCAPSTVFDVQAQVCVWDTQTSLPGAVPQAGPHVPPPLQAPHPPQCSCLGGVLIGSCNQNFQCPGQSVCQVGQNYGKQVTSVYYLCRKSTIRRYTVGSAHYSVE